MTWLDNLEEGDKVILNYRGKTIETVKRTTDTQVIIRGVGRDTERKYWKRNGKSVAIASMRSYIGDDDRLLEATPEAIAILEESQRRDELKSLLLKKLGTDKYLKKLTSSQIQEVINLLDKMVGENG